MKKGFYNKQRVGVAKSTNKPTNKLASDTIDLTDEYKSIVSSAARLGKKGYTIPKSILTKDDLDFLKKDLFVKPVTFGAGLGQEGNAFPVFRENTNKIYLPRFYGVARYGKPATSEIEEGEDISVEFTKPLRDYQENIIDVYMKYVDETICSQTEQKGNGGILEVPCGRGKCLGKNTPILMFDGTVKLVQDIQVGELIMGDDSMPRTILSLARGRETMYKVKSKKGDAYIVNESHILSLKYSTYMNKHIAKNSVLDISVTDYLNLPKSYHGRGGPLLGYRVPIVFDKKPIEIDPYLVGYWLGDGMSKGTMVTTQEASVIKYLADCFKTKHTSLYLKYNGQQYDYRINSLHKNNILMDFLRKYNMINNKHIPLHYKCNARHIQLELLAGLIDSDGYYHQNCYEIVQKNERLLDDIVFLARSLGFSAYKKKVNKTCTNSANGPKTGTYYLTNICGVGLEDIPVKCLRKQAHKRKLIRDCLKYRIQIEKLEEDDYYGFEIDGNRRFVLGDFTVTHNTVMAIKIVSLIKKKTLIIVHKEFLMNQWIERIAEFLPEATVGKIQGQVFDVEGKDIVIGMLQSLYDKEFPVDAFSSFGLTIIDEVHRIGSEQFSRSLFKTITPYMLGISATVERKDKLTKVLYMFIGDKIYSETRTDEDLVSVRGMHYTATDSEFNEVELDYRGNTKYSTMISKLCDFGPRSDFIVRVIRDLIVEDDTKQIMVLCHNRSLLSYLFEAVTFRGFATVGYYVGGMKQKNLQETELKQIVLATYAMAAEALDIKTLSTLVMVTPKTDITQSVGRILRVKHANPVIVDIIDSHDPFKKQWQQRKRFYKKNQYAIYEIESAKYTNMICDFLAPPWKQTYKPSKVTEPVDNDSETESDNNRPKECLIQLEGLDIDE
jgi:superfamily II DNA or RNA helicase